MDNKRVLANNKFVVLDTANFKIFLDTIFRGDKSTPCLSYTIHLDSTENDIAILDNNCFKHLTNIDIYRNGVFKEEKLFLSDSIAVLASVEHCCYIVSILDFTNKKVQQVESFLGTDFMAFVDVKSHSVLCLESSEEPLDDEHPMRVHHFIQYSLDSCKVIKRFEIESIAKLGAYSVYATEGQEFDALQILLNEISNE